MLHLHMSNVALTHWGRVTYLYVNKLTIIGSDNGFVAWPVPSHYISQRWSIVNWSFRNKIHWKVNRNSLIFIHEHAFGNVVWKMTGILSRPQCVNPIPINESMYPLAWCHNCDHWCEIRSMRIRDHVFHSNTHCLPKHIVSFQVTV